MFKPVYFGVLDFQPKVSVDELYPEINTSLLSATIPMNGVLFSSVLSSIVFRERTEIDVLNELYIELEEQKENLATLAQYVHKNILKSPVYVKGENYPRDNYLIEDCFENKDHNPFTIMTPVLNAKKLKYDDEKWYHAMFAENVVKTNNQITAIRGESPYETIGVLANMCSIALKIHGDTIHELAPLQQRTNFFSTNLFNKIR